ncbi:MAG: hypothetical protein ACYSPI_12080 [Planctomycetota bacterium]|jgi:hypothetical protein
MDMRKVLVLVCVAWMGAGAFALSLLGPPTAELEKTTRTNEKGKEVSRFEDRHGYIFSFSQQDIGVSGNGTVEDFEITRHYYTWGIALDENFNFNLLLGAAEGEADKDDIGNSAERDFNGHYGFSAGFNFKGTFYHGETVDWGAMVQTTYFSTDDTVKTTDYGKVDAELDDAYDIQVAVGPTVDMDGWKLYGGAYYYMLDGDLDLSTAAGSVTLDVDEGDDFGGFVGAQFDIMDNFDLIVEYAMGNDSYNIGLGVGVTF